MAALRRPAVAAFALVAYCAVMISLTMLKAFFVIGLLWRPEAQRERSLELVPFAEFVEGGSWFGPLFGAVGNIAFFVPFGVLLYVLVHRRLRPVWTVTAAGAALSLAVEVLQYAFSLGRTDVGDLLFNTLGAALGAGVARALGPRWHPLWVGLALTLAAVFAVLVALGPRLGDPSKVVELEPQAASPTVAQQLPQPAPQPAAVQYFSARR